MSPLAAPLILSVRDVPLKVELAQPGQPGMPGASSSLAVFCIDEESGSAFSIYNKTFDLTPIKFPKTRKNGLHNSVILNI